MKASVLINLFTDVYQRKLSKLIC